MSTWLDLRISREWVKHRFFIFIYVSVSIRLVCELVNWVGKVCSQCVCAFGWGCRWWQLTFSWQGAQMELKSKGKAISPVSPVWMGHPLLLPETLDSRLWTPGLVPAAPLGFQVFGLDWELHHQLPWFWGLWTWTEPHNQNLSKPSLQTACCGT